MKKNRLKLLIFALFLLSGCPRRPPRDPLDALLWHLRRTAPELQTVEGKFRQEKDLEEFDRPFTVLGTFSLKADRERVRVRLEGDRPERSILVSDGETIQVYHPAQNQVDRASIERFPETARLIEGWLLLYVTPREQIEEHFSLALTAPHEVTLVPRDPRSELRRLVLRFDPQTHLLAEARYTLGPDRYLWSFSNLQTGVPIPDDRFALDLPEETHVVNLDEAVREQ